MNKKWLSVAIVAILISGGSWLAFFRGTSRSSSNPSFQEVLRAHGGREAIAAVTAFRAQVARLTPTSPSRSFERRLLVEVHGAKFRRETVDPSGMRAQAELFDGQNGFSGVSDLRREPRETSFTQPMDASRLRAVSSGVETCGLLRLLQRCADPTVEATWQSQAPGPGDKFQVKTNIGDWFVYTDQAHLIRQIEIGTRRFQFADYRVVGGLRLPFTEQISVGQRSFHELTFSAIELNPGFPPDYFTPGALRQGR